MTSRIIINTVPKYRLESTSIITRHTVNVSKGASNAVLNHAQRIPPRQFPREKEAHQTSTTKYPANNEKEMLCEYTHQE
jgi:hypothetical protein